MVFILLCLHERERERQWERGKHTFYIHTLFIWSWHHTHALWILKRVLGQLALPIMHKNKSFIITLHLQRSKKRIFFPSLTSNLLQSSLVRRTGQELTRRHSLSAMNVSISVKRRCMHIRYLLKVIYMYVFANIR